jgi:hypothetical protein
MTWWMTPSRCRFLGALALGVALVCAPWAVRGAGVELAVRATPSHALSPVRVTVSATLRGEPSAEDVALIGCADVEWHWGDGAYSHTSRDCAAGTGAVRMARQFTAQHTYTRSGRYRIELRLVREDRVVLSAYADIRVRPGAHEPGGL